jgi:hypothetical protein
LWWGYVPVRVTPHDADPEYLSRDSGPHLSVPSNLILSVYLAKLSCIDLTLNSLCVCGADIAWQVARGLNKDGLVSSVVGVVHMRYRTCA